MLAAGFGFDAFRPGQERVVDALLAGKALRDQRVTAALIGASNVAQLESNVAALARLDFTDDELAEIDRFATDSNINIWAEPSTA